MANPLILLALLGGAAAFMLKKPAPKKTPADVSPAGAITTTPTAQTSDAVTIPSHVLTPVDDTVEPEHVPTVTVTPPTTIPDATVIKTPGIAQQTIPIAQTAQQVATQVASQVIPAVVNQVAQATQTAAANAGVPVVPPTVLHSEEVKLDQDPNGTIALAKSMINAESSPGWKTALANDIKVWQQRMGLTADGKFGPKSALKMASEVGVLPLVRYYASTGGTKAQQVAAYTAQLGKLASAVYGSNPAHSATLRSSQNYEQGQGYSTSPAAVPASSRIAQASALAEALKGA